MTLTEVKIYLQAHGRASLGDIAVHFDSSPDAAKQLLQHWIAKGKVMEHRTGGSCAGSGGCSCSKKAEIIYEWVH